MSRFPRQPAFDPEMERPTSFNGQGQIGVSGPIKKTPKVGVQPVSEGPHYNSPGVQPSGGGDPFHVTYASPNDPKTIAARVGSEMPAVPAQPAPKVLAPRSATSMPTAPAGDGQGSDPIKAPPGLGTFMGIVGQAGETMGHLGRHAANGVMSSPLNIRTWPSAGNRPSPAPAAVPPPGTSFAVPPAPQSSADSLNAWYDSQGYGPHSTESRVDAARGQRNANYAYGNLAPGAVPPPQPVAPGVGVRPQPAAPQVQPKAQPRAQPQAAWRTSAMAAPPGSPEWRQQFWKYDPKTGQHTFDHGAEAQASQGIGVAPAAEGQPRPGSQTQPRYQPGLTLEPPAGASHVTGDAYRDRLVEKLENPGYDREGGIAVYRGNAGDGGSGPSIADRNATRRAAAQHELAAYDASQANTRKVDAEIQQGDAIGNLDALSKMKPEARALFLAGKGVDAQTIAGLPQPETPGQPRFNAANIGSASRDPQTAEAAEILTSDAPIHEKAAMFAEIPGIENPNSPHRQLWDAFMARQQARGPEFDQELGQYNPQNPGGEVPRTGLWDNNPFVQAWRAASGADAPIRERNIRFSRNMGRLGYGPSQIGIPGAADDVRARIGVKPADY